MSLHILNRGNQWNEELIMLSTTATLVQFSITATLDSNVNGQTWPGDIAIDEFGVRELVCTNAYGTGLIVSCDSAVWNGNTILYVWNVCKDTLQAGLGCDSIVTIGYDESLFHCNK